MRCRPLSSALKFLLVPAIAFAEPPVPAAPAAAYPVVAPSRRVITLGEAPKLASTNNHHYQAALANAQMVQAQANRVWGSLLPEIVFNGSLVHTSAPATFDLGGIVGLV